jgi:hypothetical protein
MGIRKSLVRLFVCTLPIVALTTAAPPAHATLIRLSAFENKSYADLTGLNLRVEAENGDDYIDFIFRNESAISSVITAIYFESTGPATAYLTGGRIVTPQPEGVDFDLGASPRKPPRSIAAFGGRWEGNLLSASADCPSPRNGIGPGERLTIRFYYKQGDFSDLTALLNDPDQFRIAEHVQCLPNDASIWTVSGGESPVPLPGTAVLLASGAVLAARPRPRFLRP